MNPRALLKILLPLLATASVLTLIQPSASKFPYDYRQGAEWKYETLIAKVGFPVFKSEEQVWQEMDEAARDYVPYYRYSQEVVSSNLIAAENIHPVELRSPLYVVLQEIYDKGVVSDEGVRQDEKRQISSILYIQKSRHAVKSPVAEVYRLSDARAALYAGVNERLSMPSLDSVLRASGAYNLVVPNLEFDAQTTQLVNAENAKNISPTTGYVTAGQIIVSKGEIVTAETSRILDSYRHEYEESVGYAGSQFRYWLGRFLISVLLVFLLYVALRYTNPKILEDRRFFYVLLVFTIFSVLSLCVIRFRESWLAAVPFTLAALYLQAFMRPKVILPVYTVTLLPVLIFAHHGVFLFVGFLTAGFVSMFAFQYLGKGWKQFVLALLIFAILALCYLAFSVYGLVDGNLLVSLLRLLVASFLAIAGYPLIFLFEKVFNLVSNSRLSDLADTSNTLLRELELKAPGTFQHSLQVMNMADAAARAIDANYLLLRVAALYHDIGKMQNPLCFVENESLINTDVRDRYHSSLTPAQSARDIIRHVSDGMEAARREHLPAIVQSFIGSHHGTTLTAYFWNAHLKAGGDPAEKPLFRYPGPLPVTREEVILMLCDSIEAASRTLSEHTPEAYSDFVEKIVAGKIEEGQFARSEISIKELSDVKEAIKTYLARMLHERIAYPKRKNN